ncbi:MAG: hypothetical protein IJO20_01815 [Ruminococcus sp.]|nr:hypothetical protein [Ruminococcus sp.]
MGRKIISLVLSVILPIGGLLMLTSCEKTKTNYTLSFLTTPLYAENDTKENEFEITLDDSFFEAVPSDFNEQLAVSALTLSSTAYSYAYALNNLETLGFEHLAKFNYDDNYNQNAAGLIIASKKTKSSTIVAIILRGTYNKEWYSNFEIGRDVASTKVHEGFSDAKDFTYKKLSMYITNYGIDRDHMKFFITGHSRGAAVANLLSKALIDTYGPNNIYSYTFATPNTTLDENAGDSRYAGIFNFVNPEDFIAYIPLKEWGFTKYGTTIVFPQNNNSEDYNRKIEKVAEHYEKLKGRELKTYGGTEAKEQFLSAAFKLAPTVKDYYDTKYEIAGLELSVYEYMTIVAHLLNEENMISNGLIMLSSDGTAFEPLKNYIMSGMISDGSDFSLDYENSLISYAHTAETYLSWMKVYLEDI